VRPVARGDLLVHGIERLEPGLRFLEIVLDRAAEFALVHRRQGGPGIFQAGLRLLDVLREDFQLLPLAASLHLAQEVVLYLAGVHAVQDVVVVLDVAGLQAGDLLFLFELVHADLLEIRRFPDRLVLAATHRLGAFQAGLDDFAHILNVHRPS